MTAITHHISDALLASYAAGSLPQVFATVVAAHVSLCPQCRAGLEAHQAVGGVLLDGTASFAVSTGIKESTLALLDAPYIPQPEYDRSGIYPGPVVQAMEGRNPKWKTLGMGVKQSILSEDRSGSVRLLYIPAGQAVPDHGHNGLELTLVLQGSFSDETGQFGVGDVEIGDSDLEHTPIADAGLPCICLAATDAKLRFNAFLPRLLQPLFRI